MAGSAGALRPTDPLSEPERARGRRLAITSHPAGMTFALVVTQNLPTLALVSLGASETLIGVQSALGQAFHPLQLPTLRAVARFSKRRILIAGQALAVVGALPLVFFGTLISGQGGRGVAVVVASVALATIGLTIGNAVWFPLLRGYVERDRTGRFFGLLRSGWHLSLIVYYLAAQRWLTLHPGSFGPLFAVGWLCGVLRIAMISRLPEREERTGNPIRIREALALLRDHTELRRYLIGVTTMGAVRLSVYPFAIVLMKRELGFDESQVLYLTIALFGGGLASLYLWGHVVDRFGPRRVFLWTTVGSALLTLSLAGARSPDAASFALLVGGVFGMSVLAAGFGVADTRVLFELTPPDSPTRTLVVAQVTVTMLAGIAPVVSGAVIESALATASNRMDVYGAFFAVAAAVRLLAYLPLRSVGLSPSRSS